MEDYKEEKPDIKLTDSVITEDRKPYVPIEAVDKMINSIDSAPTYTPRTFNDSLNIVGGTDFYVYDKVNQAWVQVGGGGGTPGGSDTQIQFNNGGSFGGDANLTWDGTNIQLKGDGELWGGDTTGSTRGNYITVEAGRGGPSGGAGGNLQLNAGEPQTGNYGGGTIIAISGNGSGSGSGGEIDITAGDGGSTGNAGAIVLTSGDGGASGNTTGGNITLVGGASKGSGAGPVISITSGAGGSSSGVGGIINLTSGNAGGGNASGGDMTFTGGNGQGTGAGGTITILAGNGGATNAAGGNVLIKGGPEGGSGGYGNVVIGQGQTGTTRGGDFLFIPTSAGAITGTPTSHSGTVSILYDTSNNDLYVYNSGWKKVHLA